MGSKHKISLMMVSSLYEQNVYSMVEWLRTLTVQCPEVNGLGSAHSGHASLGTRRLLLS